MHKSFAYQWFWVICFTCVLIPSTSSQALSGEDPIGVLSDFSGDVIIKNKGSWGVEPRLNLPLYSSDKVVTKLGNARITFNDGAIARVENNSNLLIKQSVEEKGLFNKVKTVKRTLRLMLGKLLVKSGNSKTQTILQTPTSVCGLRGTVVILSVDAGGQPYIQFTEGGAAYSVGDFITGIAQDVPTELADKNPAQRAAFVAKAAADQAAKASEQAASGEISDAQEALIKAKAAEASATEVKIQAAIILRDNPDPAVVEAAGEAIQKADEAIDQAEDVQKDAIDKGAVEPEPEAKDPGEPEAYEAPEEDKAPPADEPPATDPPVATPEPPIQDLPPASPV
jgi:hypothetical protein